MLEVKQLSLALIGSPNSGKTTLYNWLTNSKFKTVNYPGATVEFSVGALAPHFQTAEVQDLAVMDTPGTYSLQPKSADEVVAVNSIFRNQVLLNGRADIALVVVDGTQMSRHLLLAEQVKESGLPMVIAVTMGDLLQKENLKVNIDLLSQRYQCDVVVVNGLLGGGIKDLIQAVAQTKNRIQKNSVVRVPPSWTENEILKRTQEIRDLAHQAVLDIETSAQARAKRNAVMESTLKIDRILLHPFFGYILFFVIMMTLFTSIYYVAAPFMDLIDGAFSSLAGLITENVPHNLFADFLANGVVTGLASVLVFAPQVLILFLGIGLLESSGYLARAATLIDKPFSKIGLSGRSFVPILSGFACAVPAIMATRNLSSTRDRWIAQFIIPLMTCSARLPVYALLLGFLFADQPPWKAGFALTLLYFGAMLVGATVAAILNLLLRKAENSFLMMELPPYRRPRFRVLITQSLQRTKSFVTRAGPIIFVFSVVMWALLTFPNYQEEEAHVKTQTSYAASAGRIIEPVFKPMGLDWRVGFGLISAFAAREVFVSSMAVMFNVSDDDEAKQSEGLMQVMSTAVNAEGQRIFTPASVTGLLVFFMIAMQCISTFAISRRESGSLKFALLQLVGFNVLAYVLAVTLVQGLRAMGVS